MSNILIISGSSDIGATVAKILTKTNNNVHLTGRNKETIAAIAKPINATYSVDGGLSYIRPKLKA